MTAARDARPTAGHLARSAVVYVRQSSEMQVRNNAERRRLQYAPEDHARALGFAKVEVIDDDLGVSGGGVHRAGFERLLKAVCGGSAGLVLAIEASRLARNGRDWHTLLEICAVVGCLVGDRDRLHDPASVDDRAFLGLKGQFADMELAIFRQRSLESREALAGRGELFLHLPAGFEKTDRHSIGRTPDQRQRDAVDLVFRKFRELRSIRQVHLWFRRHGVTIPVRDLGREGVAWRVPRDSTLSPMFRNPIYAGAYVYGRRRQEVTVDASGAKRIRGGIMKPAGEWSVPLRDRHEARYRAGRAQAQFDAVDPANRNILHNLAVRWEAGLAEVSEREERLRELEAAREAREAGSADRDAWLALGADLERVWTHGRATPQLRKNVLRAALVEITASLRTETVHLLLHWRGGDHTEIEVRRFRNGEHRYSSDRETEDLIAGLARQQPDEQTARLLNRLGRRTGKGNGWNRHRVRTFRSHRGIPAHREGERQERGELSLTEASARLGVDPSVARRLIGAGILPARQVCTGAPWAVAAEDLEAPRVVAALSGCRTRAGTDTNQGGFGF